MHEIHEFLRSLTVVLIVAAITTVVFQRLRQPVVLGYIIAGLIVGPHVPVPIVADTAIIQALSELGVILLMFSLGLEFHLAKLVRVGPAAGFTAVIQSSFMAWLGFLAGRLLGWTVLESIFTGAIVAISSTTIIAKAFDEQNIRGRLLLFLVAVLVVGMLVVPRFVRYVTGLGRAETTLVASVGICFATAYLAQRFGYSVALGAFIAGSLVAESGKGDDIERLVHPVRDVFAAIFFVSVGMLIDPALVARHWGAVAVLTLLVVVGKVVAVAFAAFLSGAGTRTSVQAGMSLAQIGEFSFIIAGLGLTLGATRDFLYPVAVAVSAVTTLTTPWLIRASGPAAAYVDRKLPKPLQTFAALYGAWLERLKATSPGHSVRRFIRLLALDAAVLSALIIAISLQMPAFTATLARLLHLAPGLATVLVVVATGVAALPLVIGIGRLSRGLGGTLADTALPRVTGKADLDAAPRRTLSVTLHLGVALLTGILVVALTQAFLPSYSGPLVLLLLLAGFGVAIWRSVRDLEGHVRAGAQAVVAALGRYARGPSGSSPSDAAALAEVNQLLPGLGAPVAHRIDANSSAVGRSLAELNLRGKSGATVLAISRNNESIVVPTADERLQSGDVVALAGSHDAIETAKDLLR